MDELTAAVAARAADATFSGVVRVDRAGEPVLLEAFGMADRGHVVPNTVDTRFGIASGTKGFTALTVMRLVEQGTLELATTVRSLLGADLALIDDAVTIEQLLCHRSGIGDYLDEDMPGAADDYLMRVPVHRLARTEDYLTELDGHATKFAPGERFSYCNGGYVVLALMAERATGCGFHELVQTHVCEPAGLTGTEFLRSDELPGDAALGYLGPQGLRTNVLHLPVRGSGDGGIFSTVGDVHALWAALFAGRIVAPASLATMVKPHSDVPSESRRYGAGFWLHATSDAVILVGSDAGVSFTSVHSPALEITHTVVSNTSSGAWPMTELLDRLLGT